MILAPALLNTTFADFVRDVRKVEGLFSYAQIDVMDGEFVKNRSFTEIEKINELDSPVKWELHLMVTDPLTELQKWADVKNIFRIIFHTESGINPTEVIAFARKKCWEVGAALNPETPLTVIEKYLPELDMVLFMTVHPGRQGNPFLMEVGEKIKDFTSRSQRPLCAVDGGVNATTIPILKSWGVDVVNVGSALMKAADIHQAHKELVMTLNKA